MKRLLVTFISCYSIINLFGQTPTVGSTSDKSTELLSGFKFRNIGPALMGGRIADIAIHPKKSATWYVAVGSGGVMKTENAGTTWTPIFDNYGSFSIGCVTIDPTQNNVVWVGTGENVGGRHVGFGDGIYKSEDDGKTFTNMGLKSSEHISKVVVHPTNSNTILVASQGPLWSKGGERGIFKSIDGGKSWKQTLGDKEWVGATDLVMDPKNPMIMYAATWQRHRTVAAYMGGGPGTAIYKSTDGGDTWTKLTNGLPTGNLGKIGLAISPQKSEVIYAAIEMERRAGGVYRSADAGVTWTKMSDAVSGATGPHYYQELYASPHQFDKLYLMDVRVQVSTDGGKTFSVMKEENKHSDNHAIAFQQDRPDYLLVGTDGGLYESQDNSDTWKFFSNMPITQFYDIAIDDSKPYNIYGGTQDNSTQGGPSRTYNVQGISNSDWRVVLDWDGQQPATEPGNPNIIYGQRQEGTLSRIDMKTGEVVDIQPSPAEGENFERWNWDAPILVSPHDSKQLFFASHRLWKSTDRGDSWTAISGDLTKAQTRINLPIMGSTQGYDNAWDLLAMSNFNTITMIAESPKQKDLIYIGTDDGLIQITEDGGKTWRKIEATTLPGVPATAYVNEIKADLYDANTAYVTLDNIKSGDYAPYIFKTTDKGKTWKSIKSNIPDRTPIWRLIQDHVNKDLLFIGTEFGIFVTQNGGTSWTKMTGGLPSIPIRDIAIQKENNDLILATFGRSIYILDDYSALRKLNDKELNTEASLLNVSNALWYIPRSVLGFDGPKGDQGAGYFMAPNPDFGSAITYHLKDDLKTLKEIRKEKEKKAIEAKQTISFPTWEELNMEENEVAPKMIVTITNEAGTIIRKLDGPVKKGIHKINWDLRYPSIDPINLQSTISQPGLLAAPGKYYASLTKETAKDAIQIGEKMGFVVKPLYENSITQMPAKEVADFWRKYEKLSSESATVYNKLDNTLRYAKAIKKALAIAPLPGIQENKIINGSIDQLNVLLELFNGNNVKNKIGEKNNPTISSRFFDIFRSIGGSTYGPTKTNLSSINTIQKQVNEAKEKLKVEDVKLKSIIDIIVKAGGPEVLNW